MHWERRCNTKRLLTTIKPSSLTDWVFDTDAIEVNKFRVKIASGFEISSMQFLRSVLSLQKINSSDGLRA